MIDALRQVTTIVTHESCADGTASALIYRDALPDAEVVFTTYNTEHYNTLPAKPGMLFCDIVPPRHRAAEFVEAGAFVRDHHRGAADIVAMFGERGVFADETEEPGVSGAMLAYQDWCAICEDGDSTLRRIAELAGIRDTWQRQSPMWREACAQAAALRFWPWEELRAARYRRDLVDKLAVGEMLLANDEADAKRCLSESRTFYPSGLSPALTVIAFEGSSTESSNVADLIGGPEQAGGADLVMAWHYRQEGDRFLLDVSCRSRGGFKAVDIAKHYGGGGHDNAAGFTVPVDRDDGPPHVHLERLVKHFLWSEKR